MRSADPLPATEVKDGGRWSPSSDPGSALALHGTIAALVGFLMALLWGLTGGGYFWPIWIWFGAAILLAVHGGMVWAFSVPVTSRRDRVLMVHAALSVVLCGVFLALWLIGGGGEFWPAVPVLSIVGLFGCDVVINVILDRDSDERTEELTQRVDELTRTRQSALEVQSAELRRVERDLHDGAQSRLVALSMQLGRAESRLGDDPEAADLVRQARGEATAAIAELRDLARGIAPPILVDRGLAEATRSLVRRSSATNTSFDAELDRRPPPVIEVAAYFVVAEALTNAAKHAPEAPVSVSLRLSGDVLAIVVHDEGPGGADPAGSGLTGLRHRVEAVDGGLTVASPRGGGTTIEVQLPCGS
jgi:signal transduction histidine kinase